MFHQIRQTDAECSTTHMELRQSTAQGAGSDISYDVQNNKIMSEQKMLIQAATVTRVKADKVEVVGVCY